MTTQLIIRHFPHAQLEQLRYQVGFWTSVREYYPVNESERPDGTVSGWHDTPIWHVMGAGCTLERAVKMAGSKFVVDVTRVE